MVFKKVMIHLVEKYVSDLQGDFFLLAPPKKFKSTRFNVYWSEIFLSVQGYKEILFSNFLRGARKKITLDLGDQ